MMEKPQAESPSDAMLPPAFPEEDRPPKVPAELAAPTSGVQEPPVPSLLEQQGNGPIKIDETDFLRYQLLGSKIQTAQILVDMYQRELQRAQIELGEQTQAAVVHAKSLEEKYSVDLRTNQVTADGYFMARPVDQSRALGRFPQR